MQNILLMGGDERQRLLCKKLKNLGYDATYYTQNGGFNQYDRLILPYPLTRDGITLNAPLEPQDILLGDVYKYVKPGGKILGGKMPKSFCDNANYSFEDYAQDEFLLYKNAVLTAQACISLLMTQTQKPVTNLKITIVGYGRIGRFLARYLLPLGALVTVVTSSDKTHAFCNAEGIRSYCVETADDITSETLKDCDVILNTAPKRLFFGSSLKLLNKKTVYFELASPPYGIDFLQAQQFKIKTVKAFGLPGRYFPESACDCILEIILKHLGE